MESSGTTDTGSNDANAMENMQQQMLAYQQQQQRQMMEMVRAHSSD